MGFFCLFGFFGGEVILRAGEDQTSPLHGSESK